MSTLKLYSALCWTNYATSTLKNVLTQLKDDPLVSSLLFKLVFISCYMLANISHISQIFGWALPVSLKPKQQKTPICTNPQSVLQTLCNFDKNSYFHHNATSKVKEQVLH